MSGSRLLLIVILLVAVPLAGLFWLRYAVDDELREIAPVPVAVLVEPRPVALDGRFETVAELTWSDPVVVNSPFLQGVVTAVYATPGSRLVTGSRVVAVDGVDRLAAATVLPFWRSLETGHSGADVAALQFILESLGLLEDHLGGVMDSPTVSAVNRFAARLGAPPPKGVFDPSWVVWLPQESFDVGSTHVVTGSPTTAGLTILEGKRHLEQFQITIDSDQELTGSWVFEFNGQEIQLINGEPTLEGTRQLERLEVGQAELIGELFKKAPTNVLSIPAPAVRTSIDESLCVFVSSSTGFRPRSVVLAGGGLGEAFVDSGIEGSDLVLANPGELSPPLECP